MQVWEKIKMREKDKNNLNNKIKWEKIKPPDTPRYFFQKSQNRLQPNRPA